MGQYNFKSSGAAISGALGDFLIQQKLEQRQKMLDDLNSKNINSEMADRTANRAIQERRVNIDEDKAKSDAEKEAAQAITVTQTRNRANAELIPKGAELAPDQAKNLLGDLTPVLTKQEGGIVPPEMGQGPDMKNVFTGTTKQEQFDETKALKEYIANLTNESKQQAMALQQAVAEGRLSDAQARLQMQQQTLDLHQKLGDLDAQLKQSKLDAGEKTKTDAANTAKMSRAELRALAEGIKNDPHLGDVVGPMAGRTPSYQATSQDLDARIQRLVSMLSLENRSKLKGQGAVSDFETKMLASAGSSLNQKTDTNIFIKELERILAAQQGDSPRDAVPGYGPEGNYLAGGDVLAKPSGRDLINKYRNVPLPR